MFRSMFARQLAITLSAILLCVSLLFSMFYIAIRNAASRTRIEELKSQAYDLAYLASRIENDRIEQALGFSSSASVTEKYMRWKAQSIYDEFNAYSVVVDRLGKKTVYTTDTLMANEEIAETFSAREIMAVLQKVLGGEEIEVQTEGESGPMFTVAVPWIDGGTVLGAVYIQTAAQTIYAAYNQLAPQIVAAALVSSLLAAVAAFFVTRQITRPLTAMAVAADNMAIGKFENRTPVVGSIEVRKLAEAFNGMAAQLQTLEQNRRDFVANVSHELRSPITSIQGFVQGMLDGTIPKEESENYMQVVLSETRRLSKLISGLLNLSRLENEEAALVFMPFDVNELIRRVIISHMTVLDDKALEVDLQFSQEACLVNADSDQIEQVIINLLSNAIKYTPQGGRIRFSSLSDGKTVRINIRDNGSGILPQDAPYIFDRFYKADKAHTVGNGTGLGLAICKRIMERHGQSIRLVSGEGGAEFEFTLAAGQKAISGVNEEKPR